MVSDFEGCSRRWRLSAQVVPRSIWTNFGPCSAISGHMLTKVWPNVGQTWPSSANFDRARPNLRRRRRNCGAEIERRWVSSAEFGPNSANSGTASPNFGRFRPPLGQLCPMSAKLGPEVDRLRPQLVTPTWDSRAPQDHKSGRNSARQFAQTSARTFVPRVAAGRPRRPASESGYTTQRSRGGQGNTPREFLRNETLARARTAQPGWERRDGTNDHLMRPVGGRGGATDRPSPSPLGNGGIGC